MLSLLAVSHKPFNGPYFLKACMPYSEQVGVKRHLGPSQGDMMYWYPRISQMKGRLNISVTFFIYGDD